MAPELNKKLFTDVTRLKLLDTDTAKTRFRVQSTPFDDDDDDNEALNKKQDEYIITGQIFPNSEPYNQRSYSIEMKLTKEFPMQPPRVRFLTPIYHLNVAKDGTFCTELLQTQHKWTPDTSLVQIIQAVVDHVDKPNLDYAVSVELGKEYKDELDQYKDHALKYVLKHGLPHTDTAKPRFRIQSTPFDGDDDEASNKKQDECLIVGQIFPNSELYNKYSYSIEIKLIKEYPTKPSEIRFLTPIYHPNVGVQREFCNRLFKDVSKWVPDMPLSDVVKSVVDTIDQPDIDFSINTDVAREYQENRSTFDEKASKQAVKSGLPR